MLCKFERQIESSINTSIESSLSVSERQSLSSTLEILSCQIMMFCVCSLGKCVPVQSLTIHIVDEAPLFYWTVPECCLSVVCANLPTLRPLFHGVSPESVMSSVRSIFRVRSTSSIGSKESQAFEKSSGFSAPDGTASSQSASREEKNHLHPADIQVKTLMSVESRPMPSRDT